MARLIDADALCKRIREIYDGYMLDEGGCRPLDFEDMVYEQPTAYDVDAVVKEIKNIAECNDECAKTFYQGMGCKACVWNTIMDLVRKGWQQ